jgi:hypothetical protein
MPLSSVLGAQSLIKPGVCTSSTRPASPYEGQTIYETDTDLVKSYDGSNWNTIGPATIPTAAITAADSAAVDTNQTTASTSYVDLATAGPSVTLTTGTSVLVFISAVQRNTGGTGNYVSVAVSGATTLAANDTNALFTDQDGAQQRIGGAVVKKLTGLTAGSNTFTLKYRVTSNTGHFYYRSIMVLAL